MSTPNRVDANGDYGGSSALGFCLAIVDMDDVGTDAQQNETIKYYWENNYVRVRIPSIHGLPRNYVEPSEISNVSISSTDTRDLPWAKIILPLGYQGKATTGYALREELGLNTGHTIVYVCSVAGSLSNLIVIGTSNLIRKGSGTGISTIESGKSGTTISYNIDYDNYPSQGVDGFNMPCEATITGGFADPNSYSIGGRNVHTGLDIAKSGNVWIHPIYEGNIIKAEYDSGWGNYVIVEHKLTNVGKNKKTIYFYSGYAHLSQLNVSVGDKITNISKQVLGLMGSTGSYSTGQHLHFYIITSLTDATQKISSINPIGYTFEGNQIGTYGNRDEISYLKNANSDWGNYVYYSPTYITTSAGKKGFISTMVKAGVLTL